MIKRTIYMYVCVYVYIYEPHGNDKVKTYKGQKKNPKESKTLKIILNTENSHQITMEESKRRRK